MRISDWSSDVCSSDLRSWSTLRPPAISRTMGFAALYPSYGVRLWLGGVEAVVVEDRVEDQRVAADRFAAPDRVDREQQHVAAAVACVDHRRAAGHFKIGRAHV